MTNAIIYCDGACSPNPGFGGWGAILIFENQRTEYSGSELDTTNNRMELLGCIVPLEMLQIYNRSCSIIVYTDSKYLCNAVMNNWIKSWRKRDWMTSSNTPVKNRDLWERLISAINFHSDIKFEWVKGHGDNIENNRCDILAVSARINLEKQSKHSMVDCDQGIKWLAEPDKCL
jgi:ribonuclease HI